MLEPISSPLQWKVKSPLSDLVHLWPESFFKKNPSKHCTSFVVVNLVSLNCPSHLNCGFEMQRYLAVCSCLVCRLPPSCSSSFGTTINKIPPPAINKRTAYNILLVCPSSSSKIAYVTKQHGVLNNSRKSNDMNQAHRPKFVFHTVAARVTDPPAIPLAMVPVNTNVWCVFSAHLPMKTGITTASKIVSTTIIVAN